MGKFMSFTRWGERWTRRRRRRWRKPSRQPPLLTPIGFKSWYLPEEGKLYCEWDAKDADAIRGVMCHSTRPGLPSAEGIYAIAAMVAGRIIRG